MSNTTTARRPVASKAELQTIEALRAYMLGILRNLNESPLTRYQEGFRSSVEEFASLLHPDGYLRNRRTTGLIDGLEQPPTKASKAKLRSIEDVRQYLDKDFELSKNDPADNRFLYGYEDATWLIWSMVDPMGLVAATDYLPQ
jgi:hypothetical protein